MPTLDLLPVALVLVVALALLDLMIRHVWRHWQRRRR